MTLTSTVVTGAVVLLLLALLRSRQDSPSVDLNTATEADIRALLMGGHKIDAIKVYRRLHRVDLKAAKEAVERLAAELPRSAGA